MGVAEWAMEAGWSLIIPRVALYGRVSIWTDDMMLVEVDNVGSDGMQLCYWHRQYLVISLAPFATMSAIAMVEMAATSSVQALRTRRKHLDVAS